MGENFINNLLIINTGDNLDGTSTLHTGFFINVA